MTSHDKTDFLGKDAIFPLLIKMGLPAMVGMLVNALYNIVDTIFVGQGVGPLAIAALSIAFPMQMLVSAFAQAIGVGSASIVSRRLGEKRPDMAARAIGTAYTVVILVTAAIVALIYAFMRPILSFFGASEAIMPFAVEYVEVVAAGFFFFSVSMCASNLVRSEGHAKASMFGMLIGAGLNTVLDPIFVFGLHMGVRGAAIATVISQLASTVYLLSLYARGKSHVPIKPADFRIHLPTLGESTVLGAPAFIQSAGMSLLALFINNTLGFYGGDEAITIYGMVHKINSIIILPVFGVAQGFQPIAGYNFGAKRFDRVKESLRVALASAFSASLVGYAFIMLAPKLALGMFTPDAGLASRGAQAIRTMILLIPTAAIQITGATYFQAVGRKTQSFMLGVSRQFLLLFPLVFALPRLLGVNGVWLAFPLADVLSMLITGTLLIREVRRLGRDHEALSV